jgi:hypothetical protein
VGLATLIICTNDLLTGRAIVSIVNSGIRHAVGVSSRLLSMAIAALVFTLSADVHASRVVAAKVMSTKTSEYGVAFVVLDKAPSGTIPACAGSTVAERAYSMNINTAPGRALLNQLTTAAALGKSVTVIGRAEYPTLVATACSVWTGYEYINLIEVVN